MEEISDDDINKALEQHAIWEVIDYLEGRLEELEDLMEEGPLSPELLDEYWDKNKIVNELLDKIDDGDED